MPKSLFADEPEMKTTALAPWFGSNRMLGKFVGEELRGCKWVGVPFAGGMAELAHIKASTIVVGDLHRHVINLALCVKCPERRKLLVERLDASPFHPDMIAAAQKQCRIVEANYPPSMEVTGGVDWAYHYFVACWMGRSHKSGIDDEFNGGISVRWNANGGDSNKRYRSAVESLEAWGIIMRRCNFVVQDAFEFLDRCEDSSGHGVYCDPPFPGPGERYKHKFSEAQHRELADRLAEFANCRVVCRFYDHPLVREMYPESKWRWRRLDGGRTLANKKPPEVLLILN